MPKALSHQWPSLPVMRSSGRSQSGGKALPRRSRSSAPSAQLYGHALRCSTAAAPELLAPPTRPLSPGHSFPVRPTHPPSPAQLFSLLSACARRWKVRSEAGSRFPPTWKFRVRNPENVTVEREERRTSAVSASVQKAERRKGGKSGGTEWKYRATHASAYMDKEPVVQWLYSICFYSILFLST